MKICLIVSLFFHVCLLLGAQKAFPVNQMTKPLRTYHVELFRPPVNPFNDDESETTELTKLELPQKPYHEYTEDTISLDTKDKRYRSYAMTVKERLMRHWTYPQEARESLIEGKVLILFRLDKQGNLVDSEILGPSSHEILNVEAERAIRAAAPFPQFPGSVTVERLNIRANFAYRLQARRRPSQLSPEIWFPQDGP
jgi:TonB family protein